jgi:hypothetical protein
MSETEYCDLCRRETWQSRMRRGPPVESADVDKFCLGAEGLSPQPCLAATRERIVKLESDRTLLREALDAFLRGYTSSERLAELDSPSNGSPFALGVRAMYKSGIVVRASSDGTKET